MPSSPQGEAPCQRLQRLSESLGVELHAQRDDLLPFPLGGNKVRKIYRHLRDSPSQNQVWITNGGINSNHCRTLAFIGAAQGARVELILHSQSGEEGQGPAIELLLRLGAGVTVVPPSGVSEALEATEVLARSRGEVPLTIPGGCHSPSGSQAYRDVGIEVFSKLRPDVVFVASGTGATQGGLVAAADRMSRPVRVVGVSVARATQRGTAAVEEAAIWAGANSPEIEFNDAFRAGGYGLIDEATQHAVQFGLSHGLPLDPTYTGKAFAALLEYARRGELDGQKVLFWHTGGLWNLMDHLVT